MLISTRRLINALFIISFPFFGYGCYKSAEFRFSAGIIIGIIPFLLILLIHFITSLYRGSMRQLLNRVYVVGILFSLTLVISMIVGLQNHIPGQNALNTATMCIQFLVPFSAVVVVQLVNRDNDRFDFARMMLYSLGLLVLVNYAGVAMGMHNLVHRFPDRISMPFINGIYDSGHVLCILNLMLLFYMRDFTRRPLVFLLIAGFYLVNLAAILDINSRLSTLIFLPLTALFVFRVMKVIRGLFTISLFTMPLMMSFSLLIYSILSQPFFVALLERVDKEDITTFNGRTYIWTAVADWAIRGGQGLFFGLGYHGQYTLRLFDFVAVLWGEEHSYNIHSHSTFLEILLGQGILGLALMYMCMWYAFKYYRARYLEGAAEAPLFAGLVYILFIWQIDMFCYGTGIGHPIFFAMLSMAAVDPAGITRRRRALNGTFLE